MTTVSTSLGSNVTRGDQQSPAANGLALVRVTIGAMLLWVFFENLGKGLYTPAGYAGLINYYIKASHSPAAWKAVMTLAANHAAMAAPMQGLTEISLGILLLIGLLTRPVGHRSASPLDAPAGNGASTLGCRNGGHPRRGGD
jgi:uncharacterized membrane protein YphA (DoxX/SURF4 family)